MAPVNLSVAGSSAIYRYPERAFLRLRASSRGLCQGTVSSDAITASNQLQRMFKELCPKTESGEPTADAPVTAFSVGSMDSWSDDPYSRHNDPDMRMHRAQIITETTFRDFAKLGEVIPKLLEMPNVQIADLNWRITDKTRNSLRSESRKLALSDAIQAAKDYGEVIDKIFEVEKVNDRSRFGYYDDVRYCTKGDDHKLQELDVTPQDIKLLHEVDVVFRAD